MPELTSNFLAQCAEFVISGLCVLAPKMIQDSLDYDRRLNIKLFNRFVSNNRLWNGLNVITDGLELKGLYSLGIRAFGLRQARYIGLPKVQLQHIMTAVAINVVRVLAWLRGVPHAKTRTSRFAALASE